MKYWRGLTDEERDQIKLFLKRSNLDLDIEDIILPDMTVFSYKVSRKDENLYLLIDSFLQVELSEEQRKFLSTA